MRRRSVVIWLTLAACGGTSVTQAPDASTRFADATPLADVVGLDAPPPISFLDFAVSGCQSFDAAAPRCSGTSPVQLRFSAISAAPIEAWLWSFGDGTTSNQSLPVHSYLTPGTYSVKLTVGTSAGTAQAQKDMFVTVTAAPIGAPCSDDPQCQVGASCLCGGDVTCPASLRRGFCSRGCSGSNPCPAGSTCANLSPNGALGGWQVTTCLPSCTADDMCSNGFVCRELRSGAGAAWTQACFAADVLHDEGGTCLSPSGTPDGTQCASGACLADGAHGLCAGACGSSSPCPSYAACATFESGPQVCLSRCTGGRPCDGDPWLDCEAPNPLGSLGFSVTETPVTYCAPKRCSTSAVCGPDGHCSADGFCGP